MRVSVESSAPPAAKAVVVTRAEKPDGPLSSALRGLGLEVLLWPAVSMQSANTPLLREAAKSLQQFDWIVFASRQAVAAITAHALTRPSALRVAAVGQATAQVLKQRGWEVHLIPSEANAEALVAAFATEASVKGKRVLFPASSRALPTITAGLTQLGAQVTQVEAYRTEAAPLNLEDCRSWIARDGIGAVTFASPSAVVELERALGSQDFARLLERSRAIAIGPTTARVLSERGRPAILAESTTLQGLALTTYRILQTRQ